MSTQAKANNKIFDKIRLIVEQKIEQNEYKPDCSNFTRNPRGYWIDDLYDTRTLLENMFGGPAYVLKRSPRNPEDKRHISAEFLHFNNKWFVEAKVCEGKKDLATASYSIKSPVSQKSLNKLLEKIEAKFENLMENKQENTTICENFTFDKFIDDIIIREDKEKEIAKRGAEGFEDSFYRRSLKGKDGLLRKIKWGNK